MKRTFFLLLVLLFLTTGQATAQGIDFFHGAWPEALAKAQAENKIIFVDAFAVWCGPCKRMANSVFPDAKVGEFFNANFVNMKIDMEKSENAEFAGKYPVSAYPTLMFIDGSGKVVMKAVGARDVDGLIELGKQALAKGDKSVDFDKSYEEGNRDPKFLYDYVCALNRAGKPSLKITNEYLKTQQDLTTPFNLQFILEGATEADSRVFDLLLKHRDAIAAQAGREAVDKRIEQACKNTLKKAVDFGNEALLAEAKSKMAKALPGQAEAFAFDADMRYYAAVNDVNKYLKAAQSYQKKVVKNNAARLHDLTIGLLRAFPKDAKCLSLAEKWAKSAAQSGGLPEYYLTLAEVYKRQGNKDKARAAAEDARKAIGENDANGMNNKVDYFLRALEM